MELNGRKTRWNCIKKNNMSVDADGVREAIGLATLYQQQPIALRLQTSHDRSMKSFHLSQEDSEVKVIRVKSFFRQLKRHLNVTSLILRAMLVVDISYNIHIYLLLMLK